MRSRSIFRRLALWSAVSAVSVIVALSIATAVMLRSGAVKTHVAAAIAERLNLETEIEEVDFSLLPRPHITGRGVTLRLPNRPDLPPFLRLEDFAVDVSLLSALRKHVGTVYATGLKIAIPPGDARADLGGTNPLGSDSVSDIIIDHFVSFDATLTFVPKDPQRRPLVFAIHELAIDDIGFERIMPFTARLTNPVPEGMVRARGTFGPWRRDDITLMHVGGEYTFDNADLSSINGIGGTLRSTGRFDGRLTAIEATGEAQVPNFSLDLGGNPVPLTASFTTVVDGTDGSTTLKQVDARVLNSNLKVQGAITNLPGPGNRQVELSVRVEEGRVEDLLAMVLDTPEPLMIGDLGVDMKLSLPPGPERLRHRLQVSGTFGLASTSFTDAQVKRKLEELSLRGQGKSKDDPIGRVLTDLKGTMTLKQGRATFRNLRFAVSGAHIALDGSYGLADGGLDFRGNLHLKATLSQAVGGFRSMFIKPFDALFKKEGSGAVLPVRITGTREQPKFSVEMGRLFGKP